MVEVETVVVEEPFGINKIVPLAQLVASLRASDQGAKADPMNTGYERLYVSPGVEGQFGHYRLYAQVEIPAMQYFNGNQLASLMLYKAAAGFSFLKAVHQKRSLYAQTHCDFLGCYGNFSARG